MVGDLVKKGGKYKCGNNPQHYGYQTFKTESHNTVADGTISQQYEVEKYYTENIRKRTLINNKLFFWGFEKRCGRDGNSAAYYSKRHRVKYWIPEWIPEEFGQHERKDSREKQEQKECCRNWFQYNAFLAFLKLQIQTCFQNYQNQSDGSDYGKHRLKIRDADGQVPENELKHNTHEYQKYYRRDPGIFTRYIENVGKNDNNAQGQNDVICHDLSDWWY